MCSRSVPASSCTSSRDDVLTIRSNDRTYRFKAAESTGTDTDPQLKKLVAAMARNR